MESYFLDEEDSLEVERLDLRRYYRVLLKKWWLVLVTAAAVFAPWAYYLKSQPPVYEATALIRFKNFAGNNIDLAQKRQVELTSRSFSEDVVAQLGLALEPSKQNGKFITRSRIFENFRTTQNPVAGQYVLHLNSDKTYALGRLQPDSKNERTVTTGSVPDLVDTGCNINGMFFSLVQDYQALPDEIHFKVRGFRAAVKSFQERIKVQWEDRAGTLMNVTLTDTDPVVVADMTNRLAQIFIAQSSDVKEESVQSGIRILEEQVAKAKQELDASDLDLKRFRERNTIDLDREQKKNTSEAVSLEKDKSNLEATVRTLNNLLGQKATEERDTESTDPEKRTVRIIMNQLAHHGVFNENATMLVIQSQLDNLESNWRDIVNKASPRHFKAKQILQDILALHVQVEAVAREEIDKLQRNILEVDSKLAKLGRRLRQLPKQEQILGELARDNKVLERQYTELLAKLNAAKVGGEVESENIEILDPAIRPLFPTERDKKQKAAFGGLFGLFLGISLVLTVEFMNKTIRTADDIKRHLRIPVLGTIPQIDFRDTFDYQDSEKIKQIDQQLVTHDYSPTPIGEAYRSLRTNLMFSKDRGRITSLVLTSNEPGDGKSFTGANLSITLAQLKSKTLLIDGDLRRGVLHNTFGIPKEPGFSNYLTEVVPLQSIIQETQIPNLSVISCGSLIPNPSELLGSHQMERFLDEVRRKFDLVVFDTPPLNAATDAVVVGTQVDAVVLVIRAGETDRNLAKTKLELFSSVPARVLGAVLNGTTADMAHPGYSYYHY